MVAFNQTPCDARYFISMEFVISENGMKSNGKKNHTDQIALQKQQIGDKFMSTRVCMQQNQQKPHNRKCYHFVFKHRINNNSTYKSNNRYVEFHFSKPTWRTYFQNIDCGNCSLLYQMT